MRRAELHRVVASFTLPDQHGRPVALWDYKHRQALALIVCGSECSALLRDFARHYAAYRALDAELLGLATRRSPDMRDLPFPVLCDQDARVIPQLTDRIPTVLVLDSYGELESRVPILDAAADHRQLLSQLSQVQMRCPECGVAEWPP